MAVGSWVGGVAGGRMATKLNPERFRLIVVVIGAIITVVYTVRVWW